MKIIKTIKPKEISWALPGEPINIKDFKAGIEEAEKGPFITLEELKHGVEEWEENQNL